MNEGKPGLRISSGSRAQTRRGYSPWHSWAGRNTHHTQGTAAVPACIRGVPQLTLSLLVSALTRGAQKPPQAAQSFPAPSPSQELALLLALSCEPGVESNPPLTHQALGAASFSFTTKRRSLLSLPQLPPQTLQSPLKLPNYHPKHVSASSGPRPPSTAFLQFTLAKALHNRV